MSMGLWVYAKYYVSILSNNVSEYVLTYIYKVFSFFFFGAGALFRGRREQYLVKHR